MKKFIKKTEAGKYEVREHGANFLYTKEEFSKEVLNGNMYLKANKPIAATEFKKYS